MLHSFSYWWYFDIFCWQDILEILIFSGGIYYFSLLLLQDKHKQLLIPFYGYASAILGTYYLNLVTIHTLLIMFTPLACALLILIHHKTLQQNFIPLHRITPLQKTKSDYLQDLIRIALASMSNNEPFTCVIEKKQALTTFVTYEEKLSIPCTAATLKLITSSTLYDTQSMLWINAHETIEAYNVHWKKNSVDAWLNKDVQEQEQWIQDALFFTTKVDALFIKFLPISRTCTLIAQGKILEQASAQHAFTALKTYFGYHSTTKQGDWYVPHTQKKVSQRTFS